VAVERINPPKIIPGAKYGGKYLDSIFRDEDGMLLNVYLTKGQAINAE
jgi:hypothetical protein